MKLTGREYRDEMSREEGRLASESGLIVIFGASDDLMEFRGVIHDEIGAYDGTTARLYRKKSGTINVMDESRYEEIEGLLDDFELEIQMWEVTAEWCPNGNGEAPSWRITTDIPHTTFNIMEDGEVYCEGIVIDTKDLA